MPLTGADYIQKNSITATSLKKSSFVAGQVNPVRTRTPFSEVLHQVQGTCQGAARVGKKCLATVNPVHQVAVLYRIAEARLHPNRDDDAQSENSLLTQEEKVQTIPFSSLLDTVPASGLDPLQSEDSSDQLGMVAARYESGTLGSEAIGYDRNGGTSYGIYQISSRAGTMARFIEYLREHAPAWAERLGASGPANTGSTHGRMPREWKKIAAEDPQRFARLQYDFIKKSHYDEALALVREQTGVDFSQRSAAVQEALWSTAVQHGPRGAADIVIKALNRVGSANDAGADERLIHQIYASRSRYFKSSTRQVRAAVQQRFHEEKRVVLAMLKNPSGAQRA